MKLCCLFIVLFLLFVWIRGDLLATNEKDGSLSYPSLINPIEMYLRMYQHYILNNQFIPSLIDQVEPRLEIDSQPAPSLSSSSNSINRIPPSLSILMNFQNDGTTALHVLHNSVVWSDSVYCKHGQIYDPTIMNCREIFCVQGFVLSPQGCIEDVNNTLSTATDPIKKPHPEMLVEVVLSRLLCDLPGNQSGQVPCFYQKMLEPSEILVPRIRGCFSRLLKVNPARLSSFEIIDYKVINETIFPTQHEPQLYENGIRFEEMRAEKPSYLQIQYDKQTVETLRFRFLIKDRNDFEDEGTETIVLFYYMTLLTMEEKYLTGEDGVKLIGVSDKTEENSNVGWCKGDQDEKVFVRDNFYVLARFDKNNSNPSYYVYVNQTRTLYGTGYYFLTMLFVPQKANKPINLNPLDLREEKCTNSSAGLDVWEFNPSEDVILTEEELGNTTIRFYDVSDIVFEQNLENVRSSKLLIVCNIAPKIRVDCDNHETTRLRLCELQKMVDRSYCSLYSDKCYLINEYEFDQDYPDRYIRVCQSRLGGSSSHGRRPFTPDNSTRNSTNKLKTVSPEYMSYQQVLISSGWLSFITTIISLFFMLLTLITYFILDELRNLPGCIIINLTVAQFIAQFSFLLGSFLNVYPFWCYINAIMTHYGFLASFFWMNVIAFDMYRNFSKKGQHILINSVNIKSRLIKYAAYAWLFPLIIILVALIIDLSMTTNNPARPCYASYMSGCSFIQSQKLTGRGTNHADWPMSLRMKLPSTLIANPNTNLTSNCYSMSEMIYQDVLLLRRDCWIQNGFSNLIFFGIPIGVIIVANAIFYILTVWNVYHLKSQQKKSTNQLRRFSKVKLPGDRDVKFYIQMGAIMGFSWLIGYVLGTLSKDGDEIDGLVTARDIINLTFVYLFILFNSLQGCFVFFAFLFRQRVKIMYLRKWNQWREGRISICTCFGKESSSRATLESVINSQRLPRVPRNRDLSQSSSVGFVDSIARSVSTTSSFSISSSVPSPCINPFRFSMATHQVPEEPETTNSSETKSQNEEIRL